MHFPTAWLRRAKIPVSADPTSAWSNIYVDSRLVILASSARILAIKGQTSLSYWSVSSCSVPTCRIPTTLVTAGKCSSIAAFTSSAINPKRCSGVCSASSCRSYTFGASKSNTRQRASESAGVWLCFNLESLREDVSPHIESAWMKFALSALSYAGCPLFFFLSGVSLHHIFYGWP